MPVYEFYCPECHVIFNFFSWRINNTRVPVCPRCGKQKLIKQISRFAFISGDVKNSDVDEFPLDEKKVEKALANIAEDAEKIDENDPKEAARLIRKFSRASGIEFGGAIEEAISRLEAGEDPEEVEESLAGDIDDDSVEFNIKKDYKKTVKLSDVNTHKGEPEIDSELYML